MSSKIKKLIAGLVCAAVWTQTAVLAVIPKEVHYPDLDNHWSKSMMLNLHEYGIINGYEDGTMRPEANVSTAEFLTMVTKALGFTSEPGDIYWASPYIEKAIELQLIDRYEYGTYNGEVLRTQMAKIIANAVNDPTGVNGDVVKAKIYDYAEISDEYKPYVVVAYGKRLITGYDDNRFMPYRPITRAEACTVVTRLIDQNGGIKLPSTGDAAGTTPGGQGTTAAGKLYVALTGNDSNDGSEAKPFATLQKAKDAIRAMKASGGLPEGGVTVYLRGGTYYMDSGLAFTTEDSGTETSPITYTAYPGEEVILSGEVSLDKSWFKTADKTAKDTIIDKTAAEKVLMVNLKEHGIEDYGEMSTRGYHYFNKGRYAQAELIVNGENQTLARYPNEGSMSVPTANVATENFGFTYTDDRVSKWKDAKDPYIVGTISINYENNTYPIESIDTAKKFLTIKEGRINTYYTNGWFFGENLLEELDSEGEYYIDRETGILYYYPPTDFQSGSYTIGLSTMKTPVFNFNGAAHITVSNLTMEGGRGYAVLGVSAGYKIPTFKEFLQSQNINLSGRMFDKTSGYNVYIDNPDNYPDAQVFPGHVWDGLTDTGDGVDSIRIMNCNIFNFGSGGIIMIGDNVNIENNHIKNIGGTGLYLRGGDLETLEPSGNTIINNQIHRVGYLQKAYVPAIAMHGVAIHVAYNDIYDAPHCIFNYHGNDHIIEFNKIHDAVKECLDMDAIYTRNEYMPQWRGNIIRNNHIYNLGIFKVGEYSQQLNVSGIRTDNYGHALQIYNNIFSNIGTAGANSVIGVTAQGNRNMIKGNIFVDCSTTFRGWDNFAAGATWDMNKQEEKERVELAEKYSKIPAFAERYPELATFKDEYYKSVATNEFDNNVVVNIKFKLSETNGVPNKDSTRGAPELIKGNNNLVTNTDPGFVDYKNGDYTLKADSEVFTKLPGFENIEMSKIGNNAPVGPVK